MKPSALLLAVGLGLIGYALAAATVYGLWKLTEMTWGQM